MNTRPNPALVPVLDLAARVATVLACMGITGARLIGHDADIPLIQIDPPPPEWKQDRIFYREETARSFQVCHIASYAGAILTWFEERPKAGGTH